MKKFLAIINDFLNRSLLKTPAWGDICLLSLFTALVTLQPYYMHRVVDYFELAIYLPGINALLDGLIPYKDFFHLRGPLELYVPAFFMQIFGRNIAVLYSYFYIGTIATLILWIAVAKEIFNKKIILYFFTLVLVARTFPRVVFQIWGGMRFGLGALALLFLIYFLKKKRPLWLILCGITTSLALLTSVEIGVFLFFTLFTLAIFASIFRIFNLKELLKLFLLYMLGVFLILGPYGIYLLKTQSLLPFIDTFLSVTQNMAKVFPDYLFEDHPRTFLDALMGMNPGSKHFKHLTPAYCYLFFGIFIGLKLKKKTFRAEDLGVMAIAFYGLIMYIFAFRKIGAAQFEMALQPEKILLFVMLESAYVYCIERKNQLASLRVGSTNPKIIKTATAKIIGISVLLFLFIGSSIGYPLQRMNHRFIAFKYLRMKITGKDTNQLKPKDLVPADIETAKGLYIPEWQNQDFNRLKNFFDGMTEKDESVFAFPDGGIYNFMINRPFIGRFPIVIFSWFNYDWADQLLDKFKEEKPKFIIFPQEMDPVFEKVYFKVPENKKSYDQFFDYIERHYRPIEKTKTLWILIRIDDD